MWNSKWNYSKEHKLNLIFCVAQCSNDNTYTNNPSLFGASDLWCYSIPFLILFIVLWVNFANIYTQLIQLLVLLTTKYFVYFFGINNIFSQSTNDSFEMSEWVFKNRKSYETFHLINTFSVSLKCCITFKLNDSTWQRLSFVLKIIFHITLQLIPLVQSI